MNRKFINARSPLRLLEKGLHGGLGVGNIGVVLAGPGVGKTAFLVGVALDEELRGGSVLHVALDRTVAHVRTHYDAVFDDLASTKHIDDVEATHAEIDQHRSIRAYSPGGFSAAKLREAVDLESEAGKKPTLILLEGLDLADFDHGAMVDLRALAGELAAEVWVSVGTDSEQIGALPAGVDKLQELISVILALEPEPETGTVRLRALKDHENEDLSALHVALDPTTLLLERS